MSSYELQRGANTLHTSYFILYQPLALAITFLEDLAHW